MNQVKILFVLSNAGDQPGGISKYLDFLCNSLDKNIYKIYFLADGKLSHNRLIHYKNLSNESTVYEVTSKKVSRIKNIKELKNFFIKFSSDFNFIYFNLSSFHYVPSLYYASKYSGSKIIVHSHSCGMGFTNIFEFLRRTLSILNRFFWANKRIDYYLSCSENAGKYLFGKKIMHNLLVIKNPIEIEKFKFDNEKRKNKKLELSIKSNTKVIGCVANLYPIKNYIFILKIFRKFYLKNRNCILLIVGSGPQEAKIKKIIKKYNLENYVSLLGQQEDVPSFLSLFDCFLFASKKEGLGISGVEAQISGCYCIFSKGIPSETKILDSTVYLNFKAKKWINSLNETIYIDRNKAYIEAYNHQYDYESSIKKIINILN